MSVHELLRGSRSEGTSSKKPSLTSDWVRSLIIVSMYGSCTSSCSLVVLEGGKVYIPLPGQRHVATCQVTCPVLILMELRCCCGALRG